MKIITLIIACFSASICAVAQDEQYADFMGLFGATESEIKSPDFDDLKFLESKFPKGSSTNEVIHALFLVIIENPSRDFIVRNDIMLNLEVVYRRDDFYTRFGLCLIFDEDKKLEDINVCTTAQDRPFDSSITDLDIKAFKSSIKRD